MHRSLLLTVLLVTALIAFGCNKETPKGTEKEFQEQAQKV
jgi:hypothetical protein